MSEVSKVLEERNISGAGIRFLPEGGPDSQLADIVLFSPIFAMKKE